MMSCRTTHELLQHLPLNNVFYKWFKHYVAPIRVRLVFTALFVSCQPRKCLYTLFAVLGQNLLRIVVKVIVQIYR